MSFQYLQRNHNTEEATKSTLLRQTKMIRRFEYRIARIFTNTVRKEEVSNSRENIRHQFQELLLFRQLFHKFRNLIIPQLKCPEKLITCCVMKMLLKVGAKYFSIFFLCVLLFIILLHLHMHHPEQHRHVLFAPF